MARLTPDEIERQLAGLDGWSLEGDAIVKVIDCGDFSGSVAKVNAIAPLADAMDHHPDLKITWSRLTVSLTTHSAGGLTPGDFELARKIDSLPEP